MAPVTCDGACPSDGGVLPGCLGTSASRMGLEPSVHSLCHVKQSAFHRHCLPMLPKLRKGVLRFGLWAACVQDIAAARCGPFRNPVQKLPALPGAGMGVPFYRRRLGNPEGHREPPGPDLGYRAIIAFPDCRIRRAAFHFEKGVSFMLDEGPLPWSEAYGGGPP